jgi:hypothetical protein
MSSQMRVDSKFIMQLVKAILLRELPAYLDHVEALKISKIDDNIVGFYANFDYDRNFTKFGTDTKTVGSTLYIDVDGMKGGVGCILYIDNGRIELLECFSHAGEELPKHVKRYRISEL